MASIRQRAIGSQGLVASAQGLGCMGMTAYYDNFDRKAQEAESIRTIGRALELGINFIDTAWSYQHIGPDGHFTNEELVGKALKLYGRENFIVATKFGIGATADGHRFLSGKPAFIREQLAESLARLDVEYVDLYYMHRMDPSTPIEETMAELKKLVEEGKVRYLGLSECTPDELRRAHAVHPITAIQMEWSLQTRDIEQHLVPVARELGVAIVAYSPLGRGFLADLEAFESLLDNNDRRKVFPRFSEENFEKNKKLAEKFFALAKKRGCTPAQLALAWVHSQGLDVFPIPGTKSSKRIEENARSFALLPLTEAEVKEIEESVEGVVGERYPADRMDSTYTGRL